MALIRELVEESLAIDSRAVRTLRTLLRPGELTRLVLQGKRVRFLTPLRLYLTSSVILFSSLLALSAPRAGDVNLYVAGELVNPPQMANRPNITIMQPTDRTTRWALERYADRFAELRTRPPQELLTRLFENLRAVLPGALILFVPFLAVALKLLYVRQEVLYVDHLVFGVHFQSALFLALAATWLVARIVRIGLAGSMGVYALVFLFMLTAYLAQALHRVYGQRWGITIFKTGTLVLAYMLLLRPVLGVAVFFVLWRL